MAPRRRLGPMVLTVRAPPPTGGDGPIVGGPIAGGSQTPMDGGQGLDAALPGMMPDSPSDGGLPMDGRPQLAVTADFLSNTLSIVDIDRLKPGGTRADALVGTVDLSAYSPGAMSVAITPDGKTALVSMSSGFLGVFVTTPPGDGTLVFVDLESMTATGELSLGDSPMGIVVTPDGKRAFVGLYAERYFAEVDLAARSFKRVSTGASYNEELALDDTGTVGILTYGTQGNVKTFAVDDPASQLGQTSRLTGDAAGVAFFPGTKTAYLMQAPTALTGNVGGHDLIDVSNPAMPVASDRVRMGSHPSTYPVTAIAARGSIAFTSTEDGVVSVVEMALKDGKAVEVQRVEVGAAASLAYGLTATKDGRVLIAVPGDHYVGVVDMEAGTAFTVPWEVTKSGPTEIKVIP